MQNLLVLLQFLDYHFIVRNKDSILAGSHTPFIPLLRPATKKLSASFRCLSLKKVKNPLDEMVQKSDFRISFVS